MLIFSIRILIIRSYISNSLYDLYCIIDLINSQSRVKADFAWMHFTIAMYMESAKDVLKEEYVQIISILGHFNPCFAFNYC